MNAARPSATTAPSPTSIRISSCRFPPPPRRPTRATRSRSCRPAHFVVRGGPVYAGRNGTPRELWQSELMWLPRVSAAWQLGTKADRPRRLRHLLRHAERDEFGRRPVRLLARHQHAAHQRCRNHLARGRSQERHLAARRSLPASAPTALASTCRSGTRSAPWRASARASPSAATIGSIRACSAGESASSGSSAPTCWSRRPIGGSRPTGCSRRPRASMPCPSSTGTRAIRATTRSPPT